MVNRTLLYVGGINLSGEVNNSLYAYDLTSYNGWNKLYDFQSQGRYSFGWQCYPQGNYAIIFGGSTAFDILNTFILINFTNFNASYVSPLIETPAQRYGGSLSTVSDFSVLFGGRDDVVFYQDLWKLQYDSNYYFSNFTLISAQGVYPAERSGHSAGVQGNNIIIVGGYSQNNNLFSDYWLLDTTGLMKWTEIIPNSDYDSPPAMRDTCVVVDLPYFYLIGGRTVTGLNFDFWQYSFTENQFYLLRPTNYTTDTPLSKHSCYIYNINNRKYIYVFFGSQSINDCPYCGISRFDITNLNNITLEIISKNVTNFACRSDSAVAFFGGYLFGFGGQSFGKYIFKDSYILNIDPYEEYSNSSGYLSNPLYRSANSQFGEYIFLYSGLNYAYYPGIVPSDTIYSFKLNSPNHFCGNGFSYNETLLGCLRCPLGTYSSRNDYTCIPCGPGFYSNFSTASDITQCLPCPEGTYSNIEGSTGCLECENNSYCPVGSTSSSLLYNSFNSNIYPKNYKPDTGFEYAIISSSLAFFMIAIFTIFYFCSVRIKLFVSTFELFKQSHYEPKLKSDETRGTDNEEPLLNYHENFDEVRKREKINYFGGYFTGLTVILLLFIIFISAYLFLERNVTEIQALVPASSLLQSKQELFLNNIISVHLSFNSYRGNCSIGPTVDSQLNFSIDSLHTSLDYCSFVYNFQKENIFVNGDFILFEFNQTNSFTSDISIYLESDCAVPNEKSGLIQSLNSTPTYVFRGNTPTVFYYDLTPAYYQESYQLASAIERKGYRLSQINFPDIGSEYQLSQIYLHNGLSVMIQLTVEDLAVTTYRSQKSDFISFFPPLLGQLIGVLRFLAVILFVVEVLYYSRMEKTGGKMQTYKEMIRIYHEEKNLKKSIRKNTRALSLQRGINS